MRRRSARLLGPVAKFLALESASGLLLLAAAAVAIVWANSPWSESYASVMSHPLPIDALGIHLDVQEWVGEGLMAIFFLVVGLEIKRELVRGELRDRRTAALPVIAAIGGMVVPALLYLLLTAGSDATHGWGIPMATDIAFAVGVVALLGSRVPPSLKLFLLSLAVVDDLGAIAVIAVFYTSTISFWWLLAAVGAFAVMVLLRISKVRSIATYLLVGVAAWYFMLRSGVHPTIAGVVLGFLVPLDRRDRRGRSMAERLEQSLHPWSAYVVIPVFALCNAGVALGAEALREAFGSQLTWGVIVGLVAGKTIGVAGAAGLAIALGVAARPRGATNLHLVGIGLASGIGFTVALFVTGLAFDDVAQIDQARVGILMASAVAAIAAALVLRFASKGVAQST